MPNSGFYIRLVARQFLLLLLLQFLSGGSVQAQGPGFPNVPQVKGSFISGPWGVNGGRTAVIAFHQGYLITQYEAPGSREGSDGRARYYDMSNLSALTETQFNAGWNAAASAHGYWQEGDVIRGFRNWRFSGSAIQEIQNDQDAGGTFFHNWSAGYQNIFPWPGRGILFQPFHMSEFWSYGSTSHNSGLFKGNTLLANFDPVGESGVIGHPVLIGNYLYYLSDQSDTGIAVYDISNSLNNPGAAPQLVGLFKDPVNPSNPQQSVGAYWPEMWGGGGKLKVLFPDRNDGLHIVDVTDPSNMFREATFFYPYANPWWSNPDPGYAQFQDNYGFSDRFKINMQTVEIETLIDPISRGLTASQFALPLGNLLVTGGGHLDPLGSNSQGMAIWAHQDAPDNKGPTVGYHVPKTGQVNYPRTAAISLLIHETLRSETLVNGETFMLRPVSSLNQVGSFIAGRLVYSFNDVLTFTPTVPLAADTTYEVYLPESGVKDAVGNGISAYRYRFSTGSTVVGDVGNSPGDGLVSPPNENSPQPDPEENPDFQTLNLEIKTNSKTSLTQKVSFIMPKTILSQLTKAGSKKAKRATVQVLINGSIVHSEKVFKIKRINLNLKKRKVALASTLGTGQNTLVVKVFIGNSQLGEGSDQV